MRDQIVANNIPKFLANKWMFSLSFIQRPDEETLETFYTILQFAQKKHEPEYTLCASTVAYSYCRYKSNCQSNPIIRQMVNLLETEFLNLFNMYRNERRTKERMIVILKALGNIGILSDPFEAQLEEIIVTDYTSIDIRLQAISAFRRLNCEKYRHFFVNVYQNYTMNTEIRIFSYLQLMRCPDHRTVNLIKTILEEEKINQVGSFVWSHLKNLAKSSMPFRIEAQGLLLDEKLSNKFKLDIRQFSRNFEYSMFFEDYNLGKLNLKNLFPLQKKHNNSVFNNYVFYQVQIVS